MTITEIVKRVYFLTNTSGDTSASVKGSFPNADLLISINKAVNYVAAIVLMADKRWRWDDSNQTDLPIGTAALVANQQDYSISSTHLIIERVEIKDADGNWHLLDHIDQSALKGYDKEAMSEHQETAGTPTEYDLIGDSIFLYPKPSYSQAASLKIYYGRGPSEFTDAQIWTNYALDGTKTPGFNTLFHDLIPLIVSYEYCSIFHTERVGAILALIQGNNVFPGVLPLLEKFQGQRLNDGIRGMRVSLESNK